MGDRIVDARIRVIKEIQGKSNENLLSAYSRMVRDGTNINWFFQQHKKEILERMANDRDYVP